MERNFIIQVSWNVSDGGQIRATWVLLLERLDSGLREKPFRLWYTEYVVRSKDVRDVVKTHIDFLTSFGVPKENIQIEDRRKDPAAGSESSHDEATVPNRGGEG